MPMPKMSVLYQEMVVETILEVKSMGKCCPLEKIAAKHASRAKNDPFRISADRSDIWLGS